MPALRNRLLLSTALALASSVSLPSAPAQAQSLPTGGKVAAGVAAIGQPSANTLTVTQSSNRAIVNWGSFSIGQTDSVTFNQPSASSAILNRVTGSTTSSIAGKLDANGQVFLVNPNGIAITKSGLVNVGGGFVGSTLDISDQNFMSGNLSFSGDGASASVSNAGTINATSGGFVALLGGTVSNTGAITVPLGKVGLGSGEQATLDLSGDGFLQVAAPTNATTADGQPLINVAGKIKASGGMVQIKAATIANAIRDAVNVSGVVSASSAHQSGGAIVLGGGPGGNVTVTGRLAANGRLKGGRIAVSGANVALSGARFAANSKTAQGGTVTVTAENAVALASTTIDASGATGGGAISIGGMRKAKAQSVSVDAASALLVNATSLGNGGDIAVWSTGATAVHGLLSAQGGALGGDGGAIETSGATLDFSGITVDAGAALGKAGSWLLDPTDLIIDATAATAIDDALENDTSVTLQTSASGSPSAPFTLTSGETQSGNGDIIVNSALAWSTGATLTLNSYNAIAVNAPITISGAGKLVLDAAYDTTTVSGFSLLELSFGNGANVQFTGAEGSGQTLTINGEGYALIYSMTELAGLNGQSGDYALAKSLTSTMSYTAPVVSSFGGTFEGLGNTISNLTINDSTDTYIGLFSDLETSSVVRDIGLVGGSVVGAGGYEPEVGELVGQSNGLIANAYATGAVNSSGSSTPASDGGLVGVTFSGAIVDAYATGPVSGGDVGYGSSVGGLIGSNEGATVTNVYATGAVNGVSGSSYVGGLVGSNDSSSITNAFATGAVSGGSGSLVGGLVGWNIDGSITNGYWDTSTNKAGLNGIALNQGSGGATGETTTVLQGGLPGAFSPSVWGVIAGQSFPYLLSLYPTTTPQVISGFAYADDGVTPLASQSGIVSTNQAPGVVFAAINGTSLGSATTGYNGFYYFLEPAGTIQSTGSNVVAYTLPANNAPGAQNAASAVIGATASQTALNVDGGWLVEQTDSSIATFSAALSAAQNAAPSGALSPIASFATNVEIAFAASSFSLDEAANVTGTLALNGAGAVTQSTAISAGALLLEGGGTFTLTNAGNAFTTLAANAGTVSVVDDQALTIGAVADASGATTDGVSTSAATGLSLVASGGGLTLNDGVTSGGAILLAADGDFVNNVVGGALSAGGGASWTIYSQNASNPTGALPADTFGALSGTNYYNDSFNFTTLTLASAPPTGDHFVTAYRAVLTPVLSGSASKVYDGTTNAPTAGLTLGATLLAAGDSVGFGLTGASYDTADVGSGETVTASGISLTNNPNNYSLASATAAAAIGAITPATLTASLTGTVSKAYDGTTAATLMDSNYVLHGVVGGDVVTLNDPNLGAYASKNAGNGILVTATGLALSGAAAGNYVLASTNASADIGAITPATLTASLTGTVSKVYDGTTAATLTGSNYVLNGVLGDDVVTLNDPNLGAYASKNVGSGILVTASGLALGGAAAGNYVLASTNASADIGAITPATLSYVADPTVWSFGEREPSLSGAVTGLVGGDALASVASGTLVFTSPATAISPAGVYPIVGGGLTLTTGDYVLIEAPSNATALTIAPSDVGSFSSAWFLPSNLFAADGAPIWREPFPARFCASGAVAAALESKGAISLTGAGSGCGSAP